jgi:hypothetical protein
MTSSVTSSIAEEPPPYDQSAAATSDLEVIAQEPELDSKNRESDSPGVKGPEQPNGKQLFNSENRVPEHHSENGTEEHPDRSKDTEKEPQEMVHTHVSGHSERGDKMNDGKCVFRKDDDALIVDNEAMKHLDREEYSSSKTEDGNLKLQHTFGNESQETGNLRFQQDWRIHKAEHSPGNESKDDRKQPDDGVRNTETNIEIPESPTNNIYRLQNGKHYSLQNGKHYSSENVDMQNEGKLNSENVKQTKQLTPEPKPRMILPHMTKN